MSNVITVGPKRAMGLIKQAVEADVPVLLVGPPGVGKSDITRQVADSLQADHVVSHPPVEDPTDPKGLPWPDPVGATARFLPFGQLARVLRADKLTLWNLEDLGHASRAVQGAYMQFVQARACGEHTLPATVRIIATTNRPSDKGAGGDTVLAPLISRFFLVQIQPALDDWKDWAMRSGVVEEVVSYLTEHPHSRYVDRRTNDVERTPEPRGWAQASRLLAAGYTMDTLTPLLAGCVGPACASELLAHIKHRVDMVPADVILAGPATAPIPRNLSALYATTVGLSYRASLKTADAIMLYAERLFEAAKGDMAVLLVIDSLRKSTDVVRSAGFRKLATGKLARELAGLDKDV